METKIVKKPKCKYCDNDATTTDYREIDGTTSKILSCDECQIIPTEELLRRKNHE